MWYKLLYAVFIGGCRLYFQPSEVISHILDCYLKSRIQNKRQGSLLKVIILFTTLPDYTLQMRRKTSNRNFTVLCLSILHIAPTSHLVTVNSFYTWNLSLEVSTSTMIMISKKKHATAQLKTQVPKMAYKNVCSMANACKISKTMLKNSLRIVDYLCNKYFFLHLHMTFFNYQTIFSFWNTS